MSNSYLLWKRSILTGVGIMGTGILLFKFTTPTEEQLIAKLSPELRLDYYKNRDLRRKEQEELMKLVKITSASNDPIWKTGDLQNPWDKNSTGRSMLVVKEEFDREQAQELQKQELEKNKIMIDELNKQKNIEDNKKRRWFW